MSKRNKSATDCSSITLEGACSNGAKLKEELLALPKNDYYRQYFEQRYYDKLFYHTLEDKYRAEQKLRRITIKV